MSDEEDDGMVFSSHTKRYNDRTLLLGTYWWTKFTDRPHNTLFCVHGYRLSQTCRECVENNDQ